jgi:hypothetical protein
MSVTQGQPAPAKATMSQLRVGDRVRVRSRDEILATLDENGCLDGMPFMPEMLDSCGKTLRVYKRAHKTCDTVEYTGTRKLDRTVHLEDSRCSGSAHGDCEAACLLFWREAWLEPDPDSDTRPARAAVAPAPSGGCSMERLMESARAGRDADKGPRYVCQATQLLQGTQPMPRFSLRHYLEDYRSGNVDVATFFHGAIYRVGIALVRRADRLGRRLGLGDKLAQKLMAAYDALQRVLPGGVPFPRRTGLVPKGQQTPDVGIGALGPGQWVRIKPYEEILKTLDCNNKTRGLYFDAEHVPYCDKQFQVRSLVHRIVDERTGYMINFKTPSIILKDVVCQGSRSDHRMFCPRSIYPYWRAAWVEQIEQGGESAPQARPAPDRTGQKPEPSVVGRP